MQNLDTEAKIDAIYKALSGDNLGNKGLVKRVEELENYMSQQKKMMAKISGASLVMFSLGGIIVWLIEKLWQTIFS